MSDPEEQPPLNPREQLVKEKSFTMEYFIEARNLDRVTAEMLKSYDKDGNGAFSKDEVVSIIIDLRQENIDTDRLGEINKLYKRLLCLAFVFAVFLLSGMFALSYSVARLTAKTDVMDDGTLVKAGTTDPISTDSRAEVHTFSENEYGVMCATRDEAEMMKMEVEAGRNVLIVSSDPTGTQKIQQINGRGTETNADGSFCWTRPVDGVKLCCQDHFSCDGDNNDGRRLSHDERKMFEAKLGQGRSFLDRDRYLVDEDGCGIVEQITIDDQNSNSTNTTRF